MLFESLKGIILGNKEFPFTYLFLKCEKIHVIDLELT